MGAKFIIAATSISRKTYSGNDLYSENNLDDLLNRYQSVYVKHDTTGQGRAILKISKETAGTTT